MGFMTKTVSHIRGFNVRIYPIAQNWTQLVELYDVNALTWIANTGSVVWMNVNDAETLEQLARILGRYTTDGKNFYHLREHHELGKLTSRENGVTIVTRSGKSPLLVRQLKYDIALSKRMFSPDPEHPLRGWSKFKHTLARLWHCMNVWI
jgi:hypothetical protein